MNNNDILKKLRVALQLRDEQIVEILELVDFRISKGELGNFFRNEDHPKYMDCGDQVLRNFLNGLVLHLRGTKENPKNPTEVLKGHKAEAQKNDSEKAKATSQKPKADFKKPAPKGKGKPAPKKEPVVQNVKFKNGKNKK
ncbi:DUF1456 family protein [Flavobacterium sp. SM15]|uniref:DUF1456 family protein n=1 Tax=Flavobacterium sp. SM15 TaxID=2908005 RepID=UPI001EDAB4A9|nr:DUF1456 family protein [Flavobacterium sp. SM15]MCG2611740.1 DUF1456 family protein [Flavobacterium sp. SM15]